MAFDYDPYEKSEEVKRREKLAQEKESYTPGERVGQASDRLDALQAPEAYRSAYDRRMNDALGQIENRKPFQYDPASDPLYNQYRAGVIRDGQRAMRDTVGQTAALTGGYASSYGASAGAQAYGQQLERMNDIMPQLYQLAYQRYRDDLSDQKDLYALYAAADERDYGRYRDRYGDYLNDRGYLAGRLDTERSWDHAIYSDDRDFAANRMDAERAYDYSLYSDAYGRAFQRYTQGVSEDQFDREMAYKYAALNGGGGGRSSGGSYSGGSSGTGSDPLAWLSDYTSKTPDYTDGDDGDGDGERRKDAQVPATESDNTSRFYASMPTRNEYAKHPAAQNGKKVSYESYVKEKIAEWNQNPQGNKRLSDGEARAALAHYGL